ncbi:MAG: preprotein translocase subunit SecA [Chloroflexi bacterium]|nr:preprotein translocase subunit SecA [Chloroflexota bacterium]|tara:strand:+ start:1406 stop:3931 length:2526 start_codon:yes stop_codon:yes gene_type:complete
MGLLSKILGDPNKKIIKDLENIIEKINNSESKFVNLTDDELKKISNDLQSQAAKADIDDLIVDSFALVRESAKRVIGLRHYDVQLMGGLVLHQGKISEMKTGEGKTLVATLPTYLNSLGNQSVHVVTVNDYLARRDAEWMGPIYKFLGLTVSCLQNNDSLEFQYDEETKIGKMIQVERKEAYNCDIIYGTNNEFGFDYLRDNMSIDPNARVQSKLSYAIVDEVDNILIDEARTPLIISGPARDRSNEYRQYSVLARSLIQDEDFTVDEKFKNINLSEDGIKKVEKKLNVNNLYDIENSEITHFVENALKAQFIFKKNQEYVVKDQQVVLVDEFTGRLMQGRRLSDGLHQAIEAKENVKILSESVTYATITLQNFFRMYKKLSGMTGTALTEAEEFFKIYKLDVVEIPTNADLLRTDASDLIFNSEKSKFNYIASRVSELRKNNSPVLIGTTSIEKSEIISDLLRKKSIPHNVLNAKFHEKEASIIAEAGKPGAVTVATNMAGRGTDIVLGGSLNNSDQWKKDNELVVNSGGLYVIGTERHESRRIDNQLRGRSGRQGDPGYTQFLISLEDDLMRRFGGERIKSMMDYVGMEDDAPMENKLLTKAVENAQSKVEGFNFEIRKSLVEYDDVMNKQREIIYEMRNDALLNNHDYNSWKEDINGNLSDFLNELKLNSDPQKFLNDVRQLLLMDENDLKEEDSVEVIVKERLGLFEEKLGEEKLSSSISSLLMRSIDLLWVEHLTTMDNMRQGIGLQAAGQRDPLIQYKKTGFELFESLLKRINRDVSVNLIPFSNSININQKKVPSKPKIKIDQNQNSKIGRNDPCPCGSGKKYKKCFGTSDCKL